MFTAQTLFMPLNVHIIAIYVHTHRLIKKSACHRKKSSKIKCITNVSALSVTSTPNAIFRSSQWNAHVTSLSLHFISISITFNATISFYCSKFSNIFHLHVFPFMWSKILFLSCSSLLRITVRLLVVEYGFCSDFHIILCLVPTLHEWGYIYAGIYTICYNGTCI